MRKKGVQALKKISERPDTLRQPKRPKIDVSQLIAERDELLAQVAEYMQLAKRNKDIADSVVERNNLKAKIDKYEATLNQKNVMSE